MVAACDFGLDESGFEARGHRGGGTEVVDAPPDILFPSAMLVAPPSVIPALGFKVTEGIDEPSAEHFVKSLPLLDGETGIADIIFRASEVDLVVGDIHIATENDRFRFLEMHEVVDEGGGPITRAVIEAGEFPLRVRRVNIHQMEIAEIRRDHASLGIVLGNANAVGDGEWFFAREDRSARVTGLEGGIPKNLIAIEAVGYLLWAGFGFLKADDIGCLRFEILRQSLAEDRADTVDVPR